MPYRGFESLSLRSFYSKSVPPILRFLWVSHYRDWLSLGDVSEKL